MLRPKVVEPYLLLAHSALRLGHKITPKFSMSLDFSDNFHPVAGVYRARDLVAITIPLLDTVILRLGPDVKGEEPARDVLIKGLAGSLAIDGRESSLPLIHSDPGSSKEAVAHQAVKIGRTIVKYTEELSNPIKNGRRDLRLSSQCEGHLWTSDVAKLLLGPRSDGSLMALYNEWLHRSILLRDALLPFENYEETPLVIPHVKSGSTSTRGIRLVEEPRKLFLLECLAGRQIRQSALVDLAKVFTALRLPSGGYGFQFTQGLVLPAFLSGSSSAYLLRHHPARIDDLVPDVLFDYEEAVYEKARRSEISSIDGGRHSIIGPGAWPIPSLIAIDPQVIRSSIEIGTCTDPLRRVLKLELVLSQAQPITVDLGQITRGRRYAYQPSIAKSKSSVEGKKGTSDVDAETGKFSSSYVEPTISVSARPIEQRSKQDFLVDTVTAPEPSPPPYSVFNSNPVRMHVHDTSSTLILPGLVSSEGRTGDVKPPGEIHVFPASHPLVSLALLGKLYPSNVVLLHGGHRPEDALGVGKGFGAKFVILQSGTNDLCI